MNRSSRWIEIRVGVTSESEEAISNALCELGSGGVALTEEDQNGRATVAGYFSAGVDIHQIRNTLDTLWHELCNLEFANGACDITIRAVPDEAWTTAWQRRFQPVSISDRLVVKPPWASVPSRPDQVIVEINPGMAFGTGEHETTRLCLRALDRLVRPGDRALDVGAGSGILSIAAAKLGARTVIGVDVDEAAVEGARENIARNQVEDRVQVFHGSLEHPAVAGPFRLIVSNIDAPTLRGFTALFFSLLEPGGRLILSGILNEESGAIIKRLDEIGFSLEAQTDMGEWWAGIATRPPG